MTDAALEPLLAAARARLEAAGAPRERLGELRRPRRILGLGRAPRIVPVGEAWHLGVLLLTDEGLAATGEILRARHEAVRGVTAVAQRRRAELAAAARRGGFAEGETVHLGWHPIALRSLPEPVGGLRPRERQEPGGPTASAPLALIDGVPHVRWSPSGAPMSLARYLDERTALLIDPPQGAT